MPPILRSLWGLGLAALLAPGCHLILPFSDQNHDRGQLEGGRGERSLTDGRTEAGGLHDGAAVAGKDGTVAGKDGTVAGASSICSADKWCWSHPLPQGQLLWGVWGTGPADVYAVGD